MLSFTYMGLESKHSIISSFKFAFAGLKHAFTKGRNFRIQLAIAVLALVAAGYFRIPMDQLLHIIIAIVLVLSLELVNTTIESLVDIVSPEIQEKARIAKDVSAATVLIAAIGSVVVGALVFIPEILLIIK
jgi:diacylglycerol kinase